MQLVKLDENEQPLAYRINDAAKAIGVSRDMIYIEIRRGKLTARKIGNRTVILRDELMEYVNSLPDRQRTKQRGTD